MADPRLVARAIADAFLAGVWDATAMLERTASALGLRHRWIGPLARRASRAWPTPPPRVAVLAEWVRLDAGFVSGVQATTVSIVAPALGHPITGAPPPRLAHVGLPPLPTAGDLAAWLELSSGELDWFAGLKGGERGAGEGPLRHYRFIAVHKGLGRVRVLEAPRPRLKSIQRQILRGILDVVPPHRSAHGFVRGRGPLSFGYPHVARTMVLRMDLADFFSSIPASRVFAVFSTLGYPEETARLLTGLSTIITPPDFLAQLPGVERPAAIVPRRRLLALLRQRHLPQGAPTSPALANLCALGLDRRLAGLADAAAVTYTRYADDLAFSGDRDFARGVWRFSDAVSWVAGQERFAVRGDKTRAMRPASRQELVGVVVNVRPNVPRPAYDRLKAILFNCVKYGPDTQNRLGLPDFRAHLEGRVAWVAHLNRARGDKLRKLLTRIAW